jgi:RNA polymerase primary sigma factor
VPVKKPTKLAKPAVAKKPAAKAVKAKPSAKATKPLAKSATGATSKRSTPHLSTKKVSSAPMASKKSTPAKTASKTPAKAPAKPAPVKADTKSKSSAAKASDAKSKAAPAAKAPAGKAPAGKTSGGKNNASATSGGALEAKLLKVGRAKGGVLTYDDINKHLPADEFSPEMLDELMTRLAAKGVKVIELADVDDKDDVPFVEGEGDDAVAIEGGDMVIEMEAEKPEESYGRSDDPVRMYLREMGNVELLSREGEIEIAKRIESGREMVISSLCESPTVMHMVLGWRDKLANGEMLLREMIDLDATYGAGTSDKFADAEREQGDAVEVEEEEEDEYDALEGGRKEKVEDYDDEEAVLSLVAMEQELLPAVLEKLDAFAKVSKALRKLQEKRHAKALGEGDIGKGDDKKYPTLLAEMVEIMLSIRFNNTKVEELMHTLYAINKRLIATEMQLLKLAEKAGVKRAHFLANYNGRELEPDWMKAVAKIGEFKRIVFAVQKGEREATAPRKK